MPILTVVLSTPPSAERSAAVAAALADLTARILRKDPKVTAVAISHVSAEHWFAGGPSLASQRKSSFFLDIRVTDGSNTPREKADYVEAVFGRMGELLGDLHPESYVHVHEVRSDAYGYGGMTQADRRLAVMAAAA